MTWKIIYLTIVLLSVVTAIREFPLPTDDMPEIVADSAEARFASGEKIDLNLISFEDLMLLPKVSDDLARNIVAARNKIQEESCQYPDNQRYKALETVHGIGEKTAVKLATFFQFHCEQSLPPSKHHKKNR